MLTKTRFFRVFCLFVLVATLFSCLAVTGSAEEQISGAIVMESRNETTKYRAVIEDNAGAMSFSECQKLMKMMLHVANYGNAAFWVTEEHADDASRQAQAKISELFGARDGVILVFNRADGTAEMKCSGRFQDILGNQKAHFLAVSKLDGFTGGDVYETANSLFSQLVFICSSSEKTAREESSHLLPSPWHDRVIFALKIALLLFASTPVVIMIIGLIRSGREDAGKEPEHSPSTYETGPVPPDPQLKVDKEARLRQLDQWLKQGLIDKKEYRELKKRYK